MKHSIKVENIRKQMEKLKKKIDLLRKKDETMGLTVEEVNKHRDLQTEHFVLHDELIETFLKEYLFDILMNNKANQAVKEIQKYVPWNGGFVLRNEEFDRILEVGNSLSEEELQYIEDQLDLAHAELFNAFEKFVDTDEGFEYCLELSKNITRCDEGDIISLISYMDSRYREFAEYLGLEISELELIVVDDDEKIN